LVAMSRPSPLLQMVFKAPAGLYRIGLGRLLGRRFLALSHRGRKSGRLYETVLEVAIFDPAAQESVVVSAYGTKADWYRNLQAAPAVRIRTGKLDYAPDHRFLTHEESTAATAEFCRLHPWEAKLAPRVLAGIGAVTTDSSDPVRRLASLPMVAFRPRQ
jgi:deazaflavin-dependent oxidoreductase (nitroreductase family)